MSKSPNLMRFGGGSAKSVSDFNGTSIAPRPVVLRALVEARDALRIGDAKAALRIIEAALSDE